MILLLCDIVTVWLFTMSTHVQSSMDEGDEFSSSNDAQAARVKQLSQSSSFNPRANYYQSESDDELQRKGIVAGVKLSQ